MAAASAASTFARALPHARITTHDPRVVQVLTAPPSYLSRGDFGLKSSIQPAVQAAQAGKNGEVRYVQAREQDSSRGSSGLEWKEREAEVLLLRRWQETQGRIQCQEDKDERGVDGIESQAQVKTTAVNQPRPSSRFDRTSRSLPSSRATGSSSAAGATSQVPNYLLYSESQFDGLLDTVREKRKEFVEQQYRLVAEAQRQHRYSDALQSWRTRQDPTAAEPRLEDFSLQEEIDKLRRPRSQTSASSVSDDLGDIESEDRQIMSDMYDLARLSQTTIPGAAYLREVLSKLDMVDPSSTTMPYQQLEASSASSSFLLNNHGLANAANGHHSLRGLQYSQPDEVFVQTFSPALPGRSITALNNMAAKSSRWANAASVTTRDANVKTYLMAVGSRVTHCPVRHARAAGLYDATGKNLAQGTDLVRLAQPAVLTRQNPVATQPVESRLADRRSSWDNMDEAFAALDLGYINSMTKVVTDTVAQKNDLGLRAAADSQDGDSTDRAPVQQQQPNEFLPGTPHWVGFNPRERSTADRLLSNRPSYFDRDRSNNSPVSSRLRALGGGRGPMSSSEGFGSNANPTGNGNKVLLGRNGAAERRRANLAGLQRQRQQQQQQQEGEGGQSQGSQADGKRKLSPNVSSLLFD
ncbi:unnamed protein product [Parajaminaea phylloscopi]